MGIILQYICGEHECTKCRHQWIRYFYKFKKNNVPFFPFNENHAECLYRWKIKLLYRHTVHVPVNVWDVLLPNLLLALKIDMLSQMLAIEL